MTDKLKDWSTTAASNNSAPPNGWPENMAPSDVNDTARQGMASVAEWYQDAEWIHLGHTASAYTSTTLTISGDVTAKYVAGRKIRLDQDNSKVAKVESSSYGAPNTTVTVSGYTIAALPSIVELHIVSDEDYLPIIPPTVPSGYLTGCGLSNNSTDSQHDIDIAAGFAKDSTNTYTFEVSALTKQIDVSWAAGTGNGGFPSAGASGLTLTADTWYRVFLIGKTDGTVDAGFDTNSDASVLLNADNAGGSGYTLYRQIGWVRTNSSSNIIQFYQDGNWFQWITDDTTTLLEENSGADNNITLLAPPGLVAQFTANVSTTGSSAGNVLFTDTGSSQAADSDNFDIRYVGGGSTLTKNMKVDSSSQIRVAVSNAADYDIYYKVQGWFDPRGQ